MPPITITVTIPKTCVDVGGMLSAAHALEKKKKKKKNKPLFKLIQKKFLARQGIAFCGDGDEKDSNILQLLLLCSVDPSFLQRKTGKYTSLQIQNELLKIMVLQVLQEITI